MKPKTTLNLLNDFFFNIIQKTILFSSPFFEKKAWSNPSDISYEDSFGFNSSLTFAKPVLNIATAKTDTRRNIKSVPPEENYYYILQIPIF